MEAVEFQPRSLSSNMDTLRAMAVAGLGLALVPRYLCGDDLDQGRLARLLPDWTPAPARIYAVMPARCGEPLALKRFLEFTAAELPAYLT